jgi:hypothetical protein
MRAWFFGQQVQTLPGIGADDAANGCTGYWPVSKAQLPSQQQWKFNRKPKGLTITFSRGFVVPSLSIEYKQVGVVTLFGSAGRINQK